MKQQPLEQPGQTSLAATVAAVDRLTLQMAWALHRQQAQDLRRHDLTMPQFMVLRALQRQDGACTMSQLADEAMQVPATMTGIVDRMEAQELVRRQGNPDDRRSTVVVLSADGRRLLDRIDDERRAALALFVGDLAEADRESLLSSLGTYLAHVLDQETIPALGGQQ